MIKKYIIGLVTVVFVLSLVFGGYYIYSSNQSQNTVESLKAKVNSEIAYLGATIISMMNGLNNISYENYKIVENTDSSEDKKTQENTISGRRYSIWSTKSD